MTSLAEQLAKYETLLQATFPAALEGQLPAATDAQIAGLRAAIAPFELPEMVEALYRWSAGTSHMIFAGYALVPIDTLVERRAFWAAEPFHFPPLWLCLFSGFSMEYSFVELRALNVTDPTIWGGHLDDGGIFRRYDSIERLVEMCIALLEDGKLEHRYGAMLLSPDATHLHGDAATDDLRLAFNPGADRSYPNVDAASLPNLMQRESWPDSWLGSVGLSRSDFALTGATHTVAELVEASAREPAHGTILGRISRLSMTGGEIYFELDDGTGTLAVALRLGEVAAAPTIRSQAEVDVVIEQAAVESNRGRQADESDAELAFMEARMPRGVPARATGLRLVPDEGLQ